MSEWKRGDVGYAQAYDNDNWRKVIIRKAIPAGTYPDAHYHCHGKGCRAEIHYPELNGVATMSHFCLACCHKGKPSRKLNPTEPPNDR